MVDNFNPTNQFHPYQPTDAVPQSEVHRSGLDNMLRKVGLNRNSVSQPLEKVRTYAQRNPGAILGGIAAVAIGLGLMRGR